MKKKRYALFAVLFVGVGGFFMPKPKIKKADAEGWSQAKAECVMEVNSRRVLYESKGDMRLPMASTTKILTAITVLEHCENIEEKLKIPKQAVGIEGSSVYLQEGDEYSVEELLYGLMLRSGNDCATALALHCAKNITAFSSLMNVTAQKAGALNSRFSNPHGLPAHDHYTTARDLSFISCYAMHNTTFKKIVSTKYYEPRNWKNKNKMLTLFEGGIGIKTGYTKEAGRCLVSAAEREGMTLVCAVLNCPTTYERSSKLLSDAFSAYEYVSLVKENEKLALTIDGKNIYGVTHEAYAYPLLPEEKELIEIRTMASDRRRKSKKTQEIIGQFEIYLSKRLLFSGNLYKL